MANEIAVIKTNYPALDGEFDLTPQEVYEELAGDMPDYPTIAFGLYDFVQSPVGERVHKPVKLAACMLVFIPNFAIFLIFRNKLIGNISMGGLKG